MTSSTEQTAFHNFLSKLLEQKETVDLEFKHTKGGFPPTFWESYSSFANTEGGSIVFGIKEKDGRFYPDGLTSEQIKKYKDDIWNQINSKQKVNRKIISDKDVSEVEYNGAWFLLFNIPRASRDQRPIYIGANPYDGTYRRNNTGDYHCSPWEVQQMLAEQRHDLAMDDEIYSHYTIDDLDQESLRAYRQMFINKRPTHPWVDFDDKKFLTHLGAYAEDREKGIEGITLAGLLMFGKNEILSRLLPNFMVDYREYDSRNPKNRWINRIYNDGTWEANLFQAYRRILPKLQSFLPIPFKLKGNDREDEPPSHVAMREAFVNLCIHAQFQTGITTLVVNKYPNEIVLSNPGTLLISKDQFYAGGTTVCRNPSLQRMFMMIGGAEKAGSGADKIIEGWREANFRTPVIYEQSQPNRVELIMPLESTMPPEVKVKMEELFGEAVTSLGRDENIVLALTISMGHVSNEVLRHSLDLHPTDITKVLRGLCDRGMLLSSGFGRGTTYEIAKDFVRNCQPKVKEKTGFTPQEPLGGLFAFSNDAEVVTTANIETSAEANAKASAEANAKASAKANAKASAGTPRDKELIIRELTKYCKVWRKSSEMARYVGKSPNYISGRIVPEMLRRDLIEREYPDNPKDSRQRYRVKRKTN